MRKKRFFYKSLLLRRGFYKRGFTLIEVLLATLLLVVGVTAVVTVMGTGMYSDNTVEGQVIALNLAQEKLEEIKNASSYSDVDSYAATPAAVAAPGEPFSEYEREVLVSGTPKLVTVNIYWTFRMQQQMLTLQTLIADLGN